MAGRIAGARESGVEGSPWATSHERNLGGALHQRPFDPLNLDSVVVKTSGRFDAYGYRVAFVDTVESRPFPSETYSRIA